MIIVLVLGLVLGLTILLVRTDVRDELDKIGRTPEWIINWTTDGEAKQISTCLFTRLEESSLVPAGFLTAQFLQKT